MRTILVAGFVSILHLVAAAQETILYVSSTGDDANPGTDVAAPKKTIQGAVNKVASLDPLIQNCRIQILDSANYDERVSISSITTNGYTLTIEPYGIDANPQFAPIPVIGKLGSSSTTDGAFNIYNTLGVRLRHLRLQGKGIAGAKIVQVSASAQFRAEDCRLEWVEPPQNNCIDFYATNSSPVTVASCSFLGGTAGTSATYCLSINNCANSEISGNLIQNATRNTLVRIASSNSVSIRQNTIDSSAYNLCLFVTGSLSPVIQNNVLCGNQAGVELSSSSHGATIVNNSICKTNLAGQGIIKLVGSKNAQIRNNIVQSTASSSDQWAVWVDGTSQTGFTSNYNNFFMTGANAYVGKWGSANKKTLADWTGADGQDAASIAADPLFADPANGDLHVKSQYGRWDPIQYTFVMDGITSPSIDAGDPNDAYDLEPPDANGSRVNQGAYGNTPEASKSAPNLAPSDPAVQIHPAWLNSTQIVLGATSSDPDSDQTFKLQFEVRPSDQAFTSPGTAAVTGPSFFQSAWSNGNGVQSLSVTVSNLVDGGIYHWQVRAVDSKGGLSAWVPYSADAVHFGVDLGAPQANAPTVAQNPNQGIYAVAWSASFVGAPVEIEGVTLERRKLEESAFTTIAMGTELGNSTVTWNNPSFPLSGGALSGIYAESGVPQWSYVYRMRAVDLADNESVSPESVVVVVDTTPPAAPSAPDLTSDTGLSDSDHVTMAATLTFTGIAEANSLVTLYRNVTTVAGTGTADSQGNYSIHSAAPGDGDYLYSVRAKDAAGNESTLSDALEVTVDKSSPAVLLATTSPTITNSNIGISVSFSETVSAFDESNVFVSNATFQGFSQNGFSLVANEDGTVIVSIGAGKVTDLAGNQNTASNELTFIVDTAAPEAPTITSPTSGSALNLGQPTISGHAEAGAAVLLRDGETDLGTVTADAEGNWAIQISLADGSHELRARAADAAGNQSPDSEPVSLLVDTVSPDVPPGLSSGSAVVIGTPTLAWQPASDANAIGLYRIYRSGNAGENWQMVAETQGLSWTDESLVTNGTYRYRVQAVDIAGNVSDVSGWIEVTVDGLAPPAPEMIAPGQGAQLLTSLVALSWSAVSDTNGIEKYEVSVRQGPVIVWQTETSATEAVTTPLPAGDYEVSARAMDSIGNWSPWGPAVGFTVVMGILTTAVPSASIGVSYEVPIQVTGGSAPYLFVVSDGSLPRGMSLSPLTGMIVGTPAAAGDYAFTVSALDDSEPPLMTSMDYILHVGSSVDPIAIVPSNGLSPAFVGLNYAYLFEGQGGFRPYLWTVDADLPPGLMLHPFAGLLYGVPTQAGTYQFHILLTDSANPYAPVQVTDLFVTLTVYENASSLSIESPYLEEEMVDLSIVVQGTSASTRFFASQSATWAVGSGTLPPGMSLLSTSGVLAGTPEETGEFRFVVQAMDASGMAAYRAARVVVVANGGPEPEILTDEPAEASVGMPYTGTFVAVGGAVPYTWLAATGALPPGLTLDPQTGEISGTPTASGVYPITIRAMDANFTTAEEDFTLVVDGEVTEPPVEIESFAEPTSGGGGGGGCGCVGLESLLLLGFVWLRRRRVAR